MKDLNKHWNNIYKNSKEDKLGWYETDYSATFNLLKQIPNWKNAKIFIPGAGTSGLIDILLDSNAHLILNDLSSEVLERSKAKYDYDKYNIRWMNQDISKPLSSDLNDVDIWIDRAVLHFIIDDNCIHQYFKNVDNVVKAGGYAIFAEFSKSGATRCAGLDVKRYNIDDFKLNLTSFNLISIQEYTYINPSGDPRPYIYTLFKKKYT